MHPMEASHGMHILFLTDNFPPEVNAPASRTHEHCRLWVKAGHQVTVVTCAPNFPKGEVFDGYRNRLWQQETMDGIRVIRVWSFITANAGFVRCASLDYQSSCGDRPRWPGCSCAGGCGDGHLAAVLHGLRGIWAVAG
jgi:hypothetical protein